MGALQAEPSGHLITKKRFKALQLKNTPPSSTPIYAILWHVLKISAHIDGRKVDQVCMPVDIESKEPHPLVQSFHLILFYPNIFIHGISQSYLIRTLPGINSTKQTS